MLPRSETMGSRDMAGSSGSASSLSSSLLSSLAKEQSDGHSP